MIPRRLELRNFLSYRHCELDLSGVHLAVLSGPNGHGKSALLDAITWALWGKARGRGDDDRIRLHANEMSVTLDFDLDGRRYRVVRKRTRGRGSALDLYQRLEDGSWVALSGTSLRDTGGEIERLLRLDYDTFLNSAFIAQGRSNEFTTRPPSERKEVLRKVLDLEQYELLAQRANELRKERGERRRTLEEEAERLTAEVELLPAARGELHEREVEATKVVADLQAAEAEAQRLRQAAALREERERAVAELRRRIGELEEEEAALTARQERAERELEAAARTLERGPDIRSRYEELRRAREEEAALAARQREMWAIERQLHQLQRTIDQQRERLRSRLEELARRRTELERALTELEAIAPERERLAHLDAEREQLLREAEERRVQADEARQKASAARAQAEALTAQARELKEQERQIEGLAGAPECPLCHQPLTEAHVRKLLAESEAKRKAMGQQYEALLASAADKEAEAQRLEEARRSLLERAEALERERRQLAAHVESAERLAANAAAELPKLEDERAELERRLQEESFAAEERAAMERLAMALRELAYDGERHADLQRRVRELDPVEQEMQELLRAEERAQALERELRDLAERRMRTVQTREEAASRLREAEALLAETEDVREALQQAELRVESLRGARDELNVAIGELRERVRTLEEQAMRLEELRESIAAAREEEQLYDELRVAFGRDGVQAMLIDEAIPRIRDIANELLDRMTGGRIHVDLRTQRELKGNRDRVTETLDVLIGDELGVRPYEMFSGGEAFRVDFALRIALARLLAERAGASLPTLIIDEGFGTQDEEGIDRLVEAINAIAPEFELVLVVTHLDSLKERFPRRIEVRKDPVEGSLARVV